jgi:hypothetical protein
MSAFLVNPAIMNAGKVPLRPQQLSGLPHYLFHLRLGIRFYSACITMTTTLPETLNLALTQRFPDETLGKTSNSEMGFACTTASVSLVFPSTPTEGLKP